MIVCPICGGSPRKLLDLPMANFDHSVLYKMIELMSCTYCSHVFNAIDDVNSLKIYYNTEYRDFCIDDRKTQEVIYAVTDKEFNLPTIPDEMKKAIIPCEWEYKQKFEHSVDPVAILKKIGQSLKKGDILYLSVPDASRYQETEPFNFYWLALREHVQHFDLNHILMLAELCKFELVSYEQNEIEIVGKYMMPNLDVTLRYNPETHIRYRKNLFELEFKMMQYFLKQEKLRTEKERMAPSAMDIPRPIYLWGISREFMYAYENCGLKNYDCVLVDDTPIKQQKYSVDHKQIYSSDILKDADKESVLIITAIAHKEALMQKAKDLGYQGEIVEL
jgi:hypothetical protein